MRLENKVVLITGAAGGIGGAAARALAGEGAALALCGRHANVEETARPLRDAGARVASFVVDATSRSQVEAMVRQTVAQLGSIDVLLNCAGILNRVPFLEMSEEQWRQTIEVNLTGYFLVGQAVARQMVAQGRAGKIINVASLSGSVLQRDDAAYTASKAGVLGLTRAMAYELAPRGISVNSVSPATVRTGMNAAMRARPGVEEQWRQRVPIGRLGEVEDLVGLILYLAAEASPYVTGSDFILDGGTRFG